MCSATKLHIMMSHGKLCGILVDASSTAVGSCLVQWSDEGAFVSSKLTPTQMAWSTIEHEAYAVMFSLRKYRNFFFDVRDVVFSDHNPLLY